MKNITDKQIKKCIVFTTKELEKIIKNETGENVHIMQIDGDIFFDTQYSNEHDEQYFTNLLSKYFDINIKKLHCVGNTYKFNVWIEMK